MDCASSSNRENCVAPSSSKRKNCDGGAKAKKNKIGNTLFIRNKKCVKSFSEFNFFANQKKKKNCEMADSIFNKWSSSCNTQG